MSELLTVAESSTLAECETTIERGLATFVEVGQALTAIRDERLYRAEYATFEQYCRERWAIDRTRAQNFITAARTVLEISNTRPELPAPATESHARELARVPEEQRAEVWERVVTETEGKPTASAIRQAVAPTPRPAPPPVTEPFRPPAPDEPDPGRTPAEQARVDADHARRVSDTLRRIVTYCAEGLSGAGLREEYVRIYQHQDVPGYLPVTAGTLRQAGDSLHSLASLWEAQRV